MTNNINSNETILSNINTSIKNISDSSDDSLIYLDEYNEISTFDSMIKNEKNFPKNFNLKLNLFSKLSKIEKMFKLNKNECNFNELNDSLIFLRILLKFQRKIFLCFFSKIYFDFCDFLKPNLKNSFILNSFLLINDLIISFKNENFYSKFLNVFLRKIFEFKQNEKEKNIQNLINLILENLLFFCYDLNGLISFVIEFLDDENYFEISKNFIIKFISFGKFKKGKFPMKKIKEKIEKMKKNKKFIKNSIEINEILNNFFENENLIGSGIFLESEMKIK